MRILYCHNTYQQAGGEDNCAEDEIQLMRSRGHEVFTYFKSNDTIRGKNRLSVAAKSIWNAQSASEARGLFELHQIELVHIMNSFPLISPAIYYAARSSKVAVVQSLQNYRLLCPGSYLMREGKLCTKCLETRLPWPAVQHKCYRESRAASMTVATMLVAHRALGTWKNRVPRYCVCTEHGKQVFVRGGLPAERIAVKPNFVDPVLEPGAGTGGYALFAGRLFPEKGIASMLDAWRELPNPPPLKIVGDGVLGDFVRRRLEDQPNVEWLGWKSKQEVAQLMAEAACLILPSLWFEGFPKTQLEAMSLGTPVLASKLGSMGETIIPWVNGLHFEPGNVTSLRECVSEFYSSQSRWPDLRASTRQDFLEKYTADRNYETLIDIYGQAIEEAKR